MPFESGSMTTTIFSLPEKLPENFLELFHNARAGMLDDVKDEPQTGWVSGRHLLETSINEETAICGGHFYFNLRTAERKIPSSLLKAICRREELVYMKANETFSVPTKIRREIKETATEQNLMKMPPSISGVPAVIDMTDRTLYLGATSTKQVDEFIGMFYKTVNIEPVQMNIETMLESNNLGSEHDLPNVKFSEKSDFEAVPARDFLTWLWFYSEHEGGGINHEQFGDFVIIIEAPLTLAFASEAKGAAETMLKKGDRPLYSAEAKAALSVGKKLKKAKFTLARGEDIWGGTFDAEKFCFSGLSVPEGEEMELHSRFAERILNLSIFRLVMEEYFKKFVETVKHPDLKETEKQFAKWSIERESF
ncbi:MAG: recombination-associated protein RdgC [Victivallaceae bacterium]|nr:recombination-associated protein RdgC [Victivallaceae bacterium]